MSGNASVFDYKLYLRKIFQGNVKRLNVEVMRALTVQQKARKSYPHHSGKQ